MIFLSSFELILFCTESKASIWNNWKLDSISFRYNVLLLVIFFLEMFKTLFASVKATNLRSWLRLISMNNRTKRYCFKFLTFYTVKYFALCWINICYFSSNIQKNVQSCSNSWSSDWTKVPNIWIILWLQILQHRNFVQAKTKFLRL